jgi:hypothetical protein
VNRRFVFILEKMITQFLDYNSGRNEVDELEEREPSGRKTSQASTG